MATVYLAHDQVADALDYAHRHGVIDRGIKAENIPSTDPLHRRACRSHRSLTA